MQPTLVALDAPFRFRGITPADTLELKFSPDRAMELNEAIRSYRPCLHFQPRPIPAEKVRAVLAAARLAPSQGNLQPWRFVVVQDDERKRLLAQACVKGKPVAEAPIAVVAFSVEEDVPVTIGGYISAYPLDVAVAIGHLQLSATAEGLGSSWIVDFHADKVRTVLGVPEGIHPIAIIPIGYPAENGDSKAAEGRKSPDEIIAYNEFAW
jgi:nitroreductase